MSSSETLCLFTHAFLTVSEYNHVFAAPDILQEVHKCYVVYLKDSQLPHFHAQLAIQAAHLYEHIKCLLWKPQGFLPHNMCFPSTGTF